jgi:hypothetical protein
MPVPALRSLAQKAGATVDKAEKCWRNVKASAKKAGAKPRDFYAYVMGGTKKCLGLESRDLVRAGVPADVVAEGVKAVASIKMVESPIVGRLSRGLAAAVIGHLFAVEHGGRSRIAERTMSGARITERGKRMIARGFEKQLVEAKGGVGAADWDYWRSLFPNVPEYYVSLLLPFYPDNPYYAHGKAPDPFHHNPYPFDAPEKNAMGESKKNTKLVLVEAKNAKHTIVPPDATADQLLAALAELELIHVVETPAGKVVSDKELSDEEVEKLLGGESEESEEAAEGETPAEEEKEAEAGEANEVEEGKAPKADAPAATPAVIPAPATPDARGILESIMGNSARGQ